jgi:hypothetical protein
MIYEVIMKSYDQCKSDENARDKSWEHCHRAFLSNRFHTSESQVDYLALHLAFFLASWGMLRGRSFLLHKDYRVHIPVVAVIQDLRYAKLWDCSIESLQDDATIDLILECSKSIQKIYKEKSKQVNGKTTEGVDVSHTLITKILLGTFGCVPAFDRYFVKGLEAGDLPYHQFGRKSLHQITEFYQKNPDFSLAIETISKQGLYYPPARLMDMYFWQMGFDAENVTNSNC